MSVTAFLNGRPVPLSEAKVSVLDRGFMFGDGVYEVARIYQGKPFLFDEHMARLGRSLDALRIVGVKLDELRGTSLEAIRAANLPEATLYIQITRGSPEARTHAFPVEAVANPYEDSFPPPSVRPTEFLYVMPFEDPQAERQRLGCRAITFPDLRWGRCDIKSLNLLGNVFAAQAAKEAGAHEAILIKPDGAVTEGSHTSVFAVVAGTLRTMPNSPAILPGITRELVLRLAKRCGVPVEERGVSEAELKAAEEVFFTGTTTEILPVTELNGQAVGGGSAGPVARRLQEAYAAEIAAFLNRENSLGSSP